MEPTATGELKGDVYFVYDGDCPICATAAHALRIRETVGSLHLINARDGADLPLVHEVTERGYDLDEGMVIKFGGRYYHGADALGIMALLGSGVDWFNRMNALLFRSKPLAALLYPAMRGTRNALIRFKGVPKLRNLASEQAPIFKSIFGDTWQAMPPVMHQHYANRPYTRDVVSVEGVMEVRASRMMQLLAPLLKWSGLLVPYQAKEVPTTVTFRSEPDTRAFVFDREFHFPDKAPYHFRSRMVPVGGNEVIEYMNLGIGWRAAYGFADNRVTLTHRGYVWRILGCNIPLPLHWLFGEGYAEEEATGETSFRMSMDIRHPWFGEVYAYAGNFEVKEMALAMPEITHAFSEGQLFKSQVGEERWKNLSPHIQKRFDANPSPDKPIRYQGTMTRVEASFIGIVLANLVRFSGALLPHVGNDVATDILVFSKPGMPDIFKQRVYFFPGKKPFTFNSNMRRAENGDVLEFVGFGLGMKLVVTEKEGNLHFSDNGYFFSIGNWRIPLPSPLNPGRTRLVHSDMGEKMFKIVIDIQHPIFGTMYYQEGVFHHVEEDA